MPNNAITLELKSEIEELLNSYVQCIDDNDLQHSPNFFNQQSFYKIIPSENNEIS